MGEPSTSDTALVLRLWVERGDPVLRGRVVLPDCAPSPAAARGVDELVALVRQRLEAAERLLVSRLEQS